MGQYLVDNWQVVANLQSSPKQLHSVNGEREPVRRRKRTCETRRAPTLSCTAVTSKVRIQNIGETLTR